MTIANASAALPNNSLLETLRDHTRQMHRALDEKVADRSIVTRLGYIRFLTMHARILPTVEAWLGTRPDFHSIPDAGRRLRSAALAQDLALLDVRMPKPQGMSFLNETASVAGMCYVLEGSRLGAAYLASMISRNEVPHPVNFLSHGRETPLWKSFVDWLSMRDLSPTNIDSATSGAKNMFAAYLAALD